MATRPTTDRRPRGADESNSTAPRPKRWKQILRNIGVKVLGILITAAFLAWGADRAAAGEIHGAGALGPVEAFGLEPLKAAAAEYGLVES